MVTPSGGWGGALPAARYSGLLTVSSWLLAVLLPSASESHGGSSQLMLTSSSHRESLLSIAGLLVGVGRKAENACKHICVLGLL